MKRILIFFVLHSFPIYFLTAQNFSTSVSNYFKSGNGFEFVGESQTKQKKNYFDNFSDVRLFSQKIILGFRLEYSNPPEYGLNFIGLRKKYIEFSTGNLNLRAGDFYALFSKGLSLNLFENRNLAFDNGLEGLMAIYENNFLKAQLLGGDLNFLEPLSIYLANPRYEKYKIRAVSLELKPFKFFNAGINYTWAEGLLPSVISRIDTTENNIPEFFTRINLGQFDLFASYAIKRTSVAGKDSSKGSGFYGSLSYTDEGFGVTFEYKDYRFDVVDPLKRSDVFRPTRSIPLQNPPIVHKEHIFTLTQRFPHVVDFNDEVGFQMDAFYSLTDNLTINTNLSLASRHFNYELDPNTLQFIRKKVGSDIFPSLNKLRSPFWEIYIDVEYFLPDEIDSYVRFGFNRRSETINDPMNFFTPFQPLRLTTIPFEFQKVWSEELSSKFVSESQWFFAFPKNERFFNQYFMLAISFYSRLTLGLRYELTTSKFETGGRKNWLLFEGGFRFEENNLIISYGKERGGTVCSNGICRQVLPFEGFRLSLTTNL